MKKTASKTLDLIAEKTSVIAGYLMFSLFFVLTIHPFVIAGFLMR